MAMFYGPFLRVFFWPVNSNIYPWAGKAAIKSDLKCSKTWTVEFFGLGLLVCVNWHGVLAYWVRKGYDNPAEFHFSWVYNFSATPISLRIWAPGGLAFWKIIGKVYDKWFEKDATKWLNQSCMIPSAVCVPAVTLQTEFSLSSRFLRNLGSMPKMCKHALSTSTKEHSDLSTSTKLGAAGFLVKSFGECCGSTVLTTACYWPSSHCISDQMFVSVSGELITTVHHWCWTPTRVCAYATPLHSLYQ